MKPSVTREGSSLAQKKKPSVSAIHAAVSLTFPNASANVDLLFRCGRTGDAR